MRIGLFGGTFDPVHLGHLAMAEAALVQARLDTLWFVPAARNPHKESHHRFTPDERWEFLRLAAQDNPRLKVSEWEIHRPPPSYTIETVRHFATEFPGAELFWLIGADQLPSLHRWREIEELARKVTFLCAPRNQGGSSEPMVAGRGEAPSCIPRCARAGRSPEHCFSPSPPLAQPPLPPGQLDGSPPPPRPGGNSRRPSANKGLPTA